MSMGLEIGGISLGIIGWILAIVTCALPMWRVSAFVESNIITAQTIWEGLWMNCAHQQSTGQMQCKVYDSMQALSSDLQAARAMTIIAITLGVLGVLIAIMGAKCTNCIKDEASKAKTMIFSDVMFIIAGVLVLIPVSWSANRTIQNFYNPLVLVSQRREIGASLYIGWASAALWLVGGVINQCSPPSIKSEIQGSSHPHSTNTTPAWGNGAAIKGTTFSEHDAAEMLVLH
ncbi:claudin-4-like [Engraulis encrasicolus]|uniref:claudin-4-like n=1 Tax=Engraulis encrasicolus TaxID=184585 RepID=UPI002FD63473